MLQDERLRNIIIFVSLYLVLSLPFFLFFNREILAEVRDRVALDVVTIAVIGTLLSVIIAGLVLSREGVNRYTSFIRAPGDALSAFVMLAFFMAATAWWLVPELVFYFDLGWGFNLLIAVILACQLPMILFLSLMTAIGRV